MKSESRPLSLLLVDDDPLMLMIAGWALAMDSTITVKTAASCADGLADMHQHNWRPDAVLSDMAMPGCDGFALIEALAADPIGRDIPVIFLTARDRPQDIAKMRAAGAIGTIPKPFAPAMLAKQVRKILQGSRSD